MLDQNYVAVLKLIVQHLSPTPLIWAVTGSCGFVLQGLDVDVHDIHLQTDREGAYAIERIFSDYRRRPVRYSATERIRSHFGALAINGLHVEIMGDIQKCLPDGTWEAPMDLQRYRRWVMVQDLHIPVLALEYEYQAYMTLGRVEKAELIWKYLKRHSSNKKRLT